jgi:threonine dehydrogenase-like Zn-dependent dehydrogenase
MDAIQKVGVREFREHLQQYLMTSSPVAVTRHGETIGFYIPTRHYHTEAELDALKQAAVKLEKILLTHGVSEEELLEDFRLLRKSKKKPYKKNT